jgi:hypothetical protein
MCVGVFFVEAANLCKHLIFGNICFVDAYPNIKRVRFSDHINMFDPATYICLCQEVRTEISNASALGLALVFTGLR